MPLPKHKVHLADKELEALTWSGSKDDEQELREFAGEQFQYVRDDGIASVGVHQFVTDSMVGTGDILVRVVDSDDPLLRLPGDVDWVKEIFGA